MPYLCFLAFGLNRPTAFNPSTRMFQKSLITTIMEGKVLGCCLCPFSSKGGGTGEAERGTVFPRQRVSLCLGGRPTLVM